MAKVFIINKIMNHFFWESCADFHKASPFQGNVHTNTAAISQGFIVNISVDMHT